MHFVVPKKKKREENSRAELAPAEARKDGEGWRGGKRVSYLVGSDVQDDVTEFGIFGRL